MQVVSIENKESYLVGDVNVDFLQKSNNTVFKDILHLYGFIQIIQSASRTTINSHSLIDIIATNHTDHVSKSGVIITSFSDHSMVGCVRKMNHLKFQHRQIVCRNYSRYQPGLLSNELKHHNWDHLYLIKDVNLAWKYLNSVLPVSFNRHCPIIKKQIRGKISPWLTTDLKQKMNHRDQLKRKAKRNNTDQDWNCYKKEKNRCTNLIREAKQNFHKNLLSKNVQNPRKFWKTLKSIIPTKSFRTSNNVPYLENDDNLKCYDTIDKANTFCNFFLTCAISIKKLNMPFENFIWKFPSPILPKTLKRFTFKYVPKIFIEKQLKNLKRHKWTGIDDLPACLIRDFAQAQYRCHLL